jgi:hypothetical protein
MIEVRGLLLLHLRLGAATAALDPESNTDRRNGNDSYCLFGW